MTNAINTVTILNNELATFDPQEVKVFEVIAHLEAQGHKVTGTYYNKERGLFHVTFEAGSVEEPTVKVWFVVAENGFVMGRISPNGLNYFYKRKAYAYKFAGYTKGATVVEALLPASLTTGRGMASHKAARDHFKATAYTDHA